MVEQVLGNRDDRSGWWRLDRLAALACRVASSAVDALLPRL